MPAPLAIPEKPVRDHHDCTGENSGVDVDGVAVTTRILLQRFDMKSVVPCFQDSAVFPGADCSAGFVDVDDLDGVPVGRYHMASHQPSGTTFALPQWFGPAGQRGKSEQASADVEERSRCEHCRPYMIGTRGQYGFDVHGAHDHLLQTVVRVT